MTSKIEAQNNAQIVLDHIEQHPEAHDQSNWAEIEDCGTTGCVAGWTVMLCANWQAHGGWGSGLVDQDGNNMKASDIVQQARNLLGIDEEEARSLFTLEEKEAAREALRYIANGKNIDWEKLSKEYDTSHMTPPHW